MPLFSRTLYHKLTKGPQLDDGWMQYKSAEAANKPLNMFDRKLC